MRPAATAPGYPIFARSDLLIALFGSVVMAAAGAGVASWFGHSAGGAGFSERAPTTMTLADMGR